MSDAPETRNDPFAEFPQVASRGRSWGMPAAIIAAVLLGGLVLWSMTANRMRIEAEQNAAPPPIEQAQLPPSYEPPPPVEFMPMVEQEPVVLQSAPPQVDDTAQQRLQSPAMVVDLSQPRSEDGQAGAAVAPGDVSAAAAGADFSSDERFAMRLRNRTEDARAEPAGDLSVIVPEGTVIAGVLETALNSDLPGYTRAIVSRDVRSFDGGAVLIPRGSRLIGQYRSAVSLGQSRAFVIWTRLVRPDGVAIQLAEPGTDALGRGGLEGEVDTHFFRRFGGSILLSLITAGANAASSDSDTQVIIASTQGMSGAMAGLTENQDIAPTVDVAQGAPIRIFVTRDLDFSGVAPRRTNPR